MLKEKISKGLMWLVAIGLLINSKWAIDGQLVGSSQQKAQVVVKETQKLAELKKEPANVEAIKKENTQVAEDFKLNPQYPQKTNINQSWANGVGNFKPTLISIINQKTIPQNGYNISDFYQATEESGFVNISKELSKLFKLHGIIPILRKVSLTSSPRPKFKWDKNDILQGQVLYKLEISQDSEFNNIIYQKAGIDTDEFRIDANLNTGRYFWRIKLEDPSLSYLPYQTGEFFVSLVSKAEIEYLNDIKVVGVPGYIRLTLLDESGNLYRGGYRILYLINENGDEEIRVEEEGFELLAEVLTTDPGVNIPPATITTAVSTIGPLVFNKPQIHQLKVNVKDPENLINIQSNVLDIEIKPRGYIPHHIHFVDFSTTTEEDMSFDFTIQIHDENCNLVIDYVGSVSFSSSDELAKLPATYSFKLEDYGTKRFSDAETIFYTKGTQTLIVKDINQENIRGMIEVFVREYQEIESTEEINPPSDLQIIDVSTSCISLVWRDNSDNEIGFVIQRKEEGEIEFEDIATVLTNQMPTSTGFVNYIDTNLKSDTFYLYRVYAYNEFANSDYSNIVGTRTKNAQP